MIPLPLFAAPPPAPLAAPVAAPGLSPGSLVRIDGLPGAWVLRRVSGDVAEVVGDGGFRSVDVSRVRR